MNRATALAVIVLASSLAAGCSGVLGKPAPDASRYFMLSSTQTTSGEQPAAVHPEIHLGIGPVKLPGYLDTQGVVRTGAGGSVEYITNAFWAEPVNDAFARALLFRTGARVGTPNIVGYPWYSTTRVEWKVPVDVLRFEATPDNHAVLVARWSIERLADNRVVGGAQSVFDEAAGTDPALIVDALSRCIDRLADAIAAGVIAAASAPPHDAPQSPAPR